MACRLEEIPEPGDFVEYEILDQSVVVVRGDDGEVRAFQNACRHRGVKVVEGTRHARERLHVPVPRLVLRPRRREHPHPAAPDVRRAQPAAGDIDLTPVRCEVWGACAWINLDDDAPPLRDVHRAGRHDPRRVEGRVAADRVVVRVPPPGELEARGAGVPGAVPRRGGASAARHPRHAVLRSVTARRSTRGVRRRRAPVPAHDERRHGRHGPRQRRAHRRGSARHRTARRPGAGDGDVVPDAQRRGRRLAPRRRQRRPRPQRARSSRGSTSRWATASRTTSCCRCTAARRPTGSGRSGRRRR